jgi:hypothetical protein
MKKHTVEEPPSILTEEQKTVFTNYGIETIVFNGETCAVLGWPEEGGLENMDEAVSAAKMFIVGHMMTLQHGALYALRNEGDNSDI